MIQMILECTCCGEYAEHNLREDIEYITDKAIIGLYDVKYVDREGKKQEGAVIGIECLHCKKVFYLDMGLLKINKE